MNKYRFLLCSILIAAFSIYANAQNDIVSNYSDSLSAYKKQIDSLMTVNDSLRQLAGYPADNKYFKFFAPLAYYPDVTNRLLGLDNTGDYTDSNFMNLYIYHPELVQYSARNFSSTTKKEENIVQPKRLELTQQVNQDTDLGSTAEEIANEKIDLVVTKPHFWTFLGDYYLQFLQNHVSENWYKSGTNSYSMLGTATLQYNYNNKQKLKWDNKLELRLGFQTTEADTVNKFKTSDDLIRYTSKLGLQAYKSWYYTLQLIAQTQFARGLKDNKEYVYSDFMSPFNLNVSLGLDYSVATKNKRLNGSIHIAPLAFNFKYVDRRYLTKSFGIDGDHRTLEDYGSLFTIDLTWTPFNNFKWQTRMYGYTTFHKYEMEWENTFTLQFNKYISTCLYLYPRFDDSTNRKDEQSYFQFKEYFSFGFSYSM